MYRGIGDVAEVHSQVHAVVDALKNDHLTASAVPPASELANDPPTVDFATAAAVFSVVQPDLGASLKARVLDGGDSGGGSAMGHIRPRFLASLMTHWLSSAFQPH